MSITPTVYPVNLRSGILITDPKNATKGIYDKVFVASGKVPPAKTPEGKIVHVPYADLINADGTPKAAKEIWKILQKAEYLDTQNSFAFPMIPVKRQSTILFSSLWATLI